MKKKERKPKNFAQKVKESVKEVRSNEFYQARPMIAVKYLTLTDGQRLKGSQLENKKKK